MNVSLTKELEAWIHAQVDSGLYTSASEVVREALRVQVERNSLRRADLADLRRELDLGLAQLERGEGVELNDAVVAGIKARGRQKLGLEG